MFAEFIDRIPACAAPAGGGDACVPACAGQEGVYPRMHWAGGCASQYALGGGVCLGGGVSAPGVSA